MGVTTSLVAVGVTTKPMAWMRVGDLRLSLPGAAPRAGRAWPDEVDAQWRPYYQRRPPAVSSQLHDLIDEMESEAFRSAFSVVTVVIPDDVAVPPMDGKAASRARKRQRQQARSGISAFARKARRDARRDADQRHEAWVASEQERLEQLADEAAKAFRRGDPLAVAVIANAVLAVTDQAAFVARVVDGTADLIVYAPRIDDVHPCEPSRTANGAKTIKRRSRQARDVVYWQLVAAACVGPLRKLRDALPGVSVVRVAVAVPGQDTTLGATPVISFFEYRNTPLPSERSGLSQFMMGKRLKAPTALQDVLPEACRGSVDDPSIAVSATSVDELCSARFMIELGAALRHLQDHEGGRGTETPSTSEPATPPAAKPRSVERELAHGVTALEEVRTRVDAVANRELILRTSQLLSQVPEAGMPRSELIAAFDVVARCLRLLGDRPAALDAAAAADRLNLPSGLRASIRSLGESLHVAEQESRLRAMLIRARDAVNAGDDGQVLEIWRQLAANLPSVPTGADDEAEDVARALLESVAALQAHWLVHEMGEQLVRCHPDVQRRFKDIDADVRAMLALVDAIVRFVGEDPGCLQSKLGKTLGVDQTQCRNACWYLEQFAVIVRTKYGNSYLLHLNDSPD